MTGERQPRCRRTRAAGYLLAVLHSRGERPRRSARIRWTLRYWISRTIVWILVRGDRAAPFRRSRRTPAWSRHLLLQPPRLGGPIHADGHAPVPASPDVLRSEGGGHGRRRSEPRHGLDRDARSPTSPRRAIFAKRRDESQPLIEAGRVVAIAGEGRIHVGERYLLPLSEGAAYFALRSHVPLVPIAINGTSWLRFGGTGPGQGRGADRRRAAGRPTRRSREVTAEVESALLANSWPTRRTSLSRGRIGRWLTERFNAWPEGSRAATAAMQVEADRTRGGRSSRCTRSG